MRWIKELFTDLVRKAIVFERTAKIHRLKKRGLLRVGDNTYGVSNLDIHVYKGAEAKVIIGKYCSLGPNITIITGGYHPYERISTFPFRIKWKLERRFKDGFPYTNGDINIGNDVWVASNAILLSGIMIGHGAVVAAGAVVTKDVPPYAIVGGNPAVVINYRFDKDKINELLRLSWWDWEEQKIIDNINYLNG